VRHAAVDGADAVADDAGAELLDAVLVGELWLALLPQPAAASATATKADTTIGQARRTAHKQTRSRHRERL
jgi:hypothetical protein